MAKPEEIKAFLLHLGHNMWCEWLPEDLQRDDAIVDARNIPDKRLMCDAACWREVTGKLAACGMNMVVIDVGEALVYPSHPELGIPGSWSAEKMRAEVRRLKAMGLEPIPKLNFSTTHDGWLKDYHRMVSTPEYYQVVNDTIGDVLEVFEHPRLIHLGFDEEHPDWQRKLNYFVMRQGELWWHDFLYTVKCAEDRGARAWVWSACGPHKPDYVARCPKSVLQMPWYYDALDAGLSMDPKVNRHWWKLQNMIDLDKAGFEQVPCGSNWVGGPRKSHGKNADEVMGLVVKFARAHVSPERLKGFLMAPWARCEPGDAGHGRNMRGAELFAAALKGDGLSVFCDAAK